MFSSPPNDSLGQELDRLPVLQNRNQSSTRDINGDCSKFTSSLHCISIKSVLQQATIQSRKQAFLCTNVTLDGQFWRINAYLPICQSWAATYPGFPHNLLWTCSRHHWLKTRTPWWVENDSDPVADNALKCHNTHLIRLLPSLDDRRIQRDRLVRWSMRTVWIRGRCCDNCIINRMAS